MTTLKEHNEAFRAFRSDRPAYPIKNGISCPECGGELSDKDDRILLSLPAQKNVLCEECGHKGLAIA